MTTASHGRPEPATVIGAYAAQPAEPAQRQAFIAEVLRLPGCSGLEIPYGSADYQQDRTWLWDALPPGGTHVLTLVAATMEALTGDPAWGPASTSDAGRRAWLELLARARERVARATASGHRIVAVQVQSAPRATEPVASGAAALAETLATAASWDWCGATLTVEHCDARRPDGRFAKGFLPLVEEIAVVRAIAAAGPPTAVGITINWGRSALEAQDAAGVDAHLRAAREAGVLTGLMLSGTPRADGAFGPAWTDSHAPLFDEDPGIGEPTSLLTVDLVRQALHGAGPGLRYAGLKIGVRPRDLASEQRLGFIARLLTAVRAGRPAPPAG